MAPRCSKTPGGHRRCPVPEDGCPACRWAQVTWQATSPASPRRLGLGRGGRAGSGRERASGWAAPGEVWGQSGGLGSAQAQGGRGGASAASRLEPRVGLLAPAGQRHTLAVRTRWPCSLAGQLPDVQCAHQGGGAPAGAGAGKLCRGAGRPGDGAGSCHTLDAGALVSGASGRRPDAASRKQVPPQEALPWRGRGGSGPWSSARRNHVGDPGDLSALSRGHAAGSGSLARPRALPPQAVCVCPATEQLGRAAAVRPGPGGKAPLRFRRAEWSHVPRSCLRGS